MLTTTMFCRSWMIILGCSLTVSASLLPDFLDIAGDKVFHLGKVTYLAVNSDPVALVEAKGARYQSPATHIVVNTTKVSGHYFKSVIKAYLEDDDVFTPDFLKRVIVTSTRHDAHLDKSASDYLASLGSELLFTPSGQTTGPLSSKPTLPEGPLFLVADGESVQISKVFRLYEDVYRTFVSGVYEVNGTHRSLGLFSPEWGYPLIPVPSRLYSRGEKGPFAGFRVGVKDIYDVQGVVTTAGSRAYTAVAKPANATAPSIQRVIDLGGVIVGKQKTSQFASAALPWQWVDAYHPMNPRGDGLLSCSASSAGGGCSIAAYTWLDFAIGTDTGQSVRQPAAFSGTYGNRPSQGLMTMDGVVPISHSADTAGFFSRDPQKWAKFARSWYDSKLFQDPSLNGLPKLEVPNNTLYPKRILYPIDHLPLQNPAAQQILEKFLQSLHDSFGMKKVEINLTETIETSTGKPITQILGELGNHIWSFDQGVEVATPLLRKYAPKFPALEEPYRTSFRNFSTNRGPYEKVLRSRLESFKDWEDKVLYSNEKTCSESILIYDIGAGGLPTFRQQDLNDSPGASLPAITGTVEAGSIVASYFGGPDFTIPIGQVKYFSNVIYEEVFMPVTVNMVARRGCDMVLFNLVHDLSERGILKTVQVGPKPFR